MPKPIAFALFIASIAAADAAAARSGQCYDADGRRTGPAYDAGAPDREWIRYVTARGGSCTFAVGEASKPRRRFTEHEMPNHRHLLRHTETQRD